MSPEHEPAPERLVLVSDLHLGAGDERDPFCRDRQFVAFCRHLAGTRPVVPDGRRFAVLGDFLELLDTTAGEEGRLASSATIALARLDRIVRAHPAVFGAMADLVDAGWGLDVVVGNHDVELVRPALQERMTKLLDRGAAHGGRVRFHPWVLHVPGVLYAEHGHQYHDINWFPELVWAAGEDGGAPIEHPLAAHLGGGMAAGAVAVASHFAHRVLGARDPRRRRYRAEALAALAEEVPLSANALRRIDLLPAASTAAMALRLGLEFPRRSHGHAPYLWRAARRVDGVLQEEGAGCSFYAFGHSHIAEKGPLEGADGPVYVNPGTWSRDVRGPLGHASDDEQCTFAVIDCPGRERASATLRSWRHDDGAVAGIDR
ncbi:MAG: hypothetical protein LC791_16425 [Acidobacteria bacterium]|nr:hypothetical protein [Acidobacteriota bacterium]